jgi:hypothetical protein
MSKLSRFLAHRGFEGPGKLGRFDFVVYRDDSLPGFFEKGEIVANLQGEFSRVFGGAIVNCYSDGAAVVLVEGWPEAVRYDVVNALDVLGRYPDGHGSTEAGDAQVCHELERCGAFLGFTDTPP